ncbi:MAG: hypothetical protein LBR61_08370 [Synergistaceae bacterium]|nr:hypothetical protein [Synergistaceae bacterium]
MKNMDRDKIISAAVMATAADVCNMTCDRIESLKAGHGMLNLAIHTTGNVIAESILSGMDTKLSNANVQTLPLDDVMKKVVQTAKDSGCDGANAALISAVMIYMAGTAAQVGIPAGNRKLGAIARIAAGADRCGVATIPTAKMGSKISGFAAVQAIYQAMWEGKLTRINGYKLPLNVGVSPFYGHSALGEDYCFPDLAINGAKIGTKAMMDACAGAGMAPHAFTCALFGAAAILEIVHPDAEVAEEHGVYGKINTAYLAGKTAAETAGLPEKLHIKGIDEEYDTARLIGDLGLILKDVGGPSVIGMMALSEIMAAFREGIAGSSGGAGNSPLGHLGGYAVVAMKALLHFRGDKEAAKKAWVEERIGSNMSPEHALCNIYFVAKKAAEIKPGPVTDVLLDGAYPALAQGIFRRASFAYDELSSGKKLEEVVASLEAERKATIEAGAAKILSEKLGKKISVKILTIRPAARRKISKLATRYLSFDPYFDIEVTADGKTTVLKGLANDIIPKAVLGELPDLLWAIPPACPPCAEIVLSGNNLLNIVVPVAVACVLKLHEPAEAAEIAEKAAYITASIPGAKAPARKIGELAVNIMNFTLSGSVS